MGSLKHASRGQLLSLGGKKSEDEDGDGDGYGDEDEDHITLDLIQETLGVEIPQVGCPRFWGIGY